MLENPLKEVYQEDYASSELDLLVSEDYQYLLELKYYFLAMVE